MADSTPEPATGFTFEWNNDDLPPVVLADVLHWRVAPDRCYLSIGQFSVPVQIGPFPAGTVVSVEPLVRLVITPDTLKAWAQLLNQAVEAVVAQGSAR